MVIQFHKFYFNICHRKDLFCEGVGIVGKGNDTFDPSIYKHLGAQGI